jgi:hypothetical protein
MQVLPAQVLPAEVQEEQLLILGQVPAVQRVVLEQAVIQEQELPPAVLPLTRGQDPAVIQVTQVTPEEMHPFQIKQQKCLIELPIRLL